MTKNGVIKRWDAVKGFGFIRSRDVAVDVFFHVKTFRSNSGVLPHEGMAVQFEEVHVGGKGPRAILVQQAQGENPLDANESRKNLRSIPATASETSALAALSLHRPRKEPVKNTARSRPKRAAQAVAPAFHLQTFLVMLLVWVGLLVFGLMSQRLSIWVAPFLALLNIATLFAYAFDKNAAERGWWRTQETTLHLFAIFGGWPAAWFAQQIMRHKTSKQSFQSGYWATAVLHCVLLGGWTFELPKNLMPLLN